MMDDKRVEAAAKVICLELNGISYRDADNNEKEEATFLANAAITASDAAAWQPIETAPRDDTVLVYSKNKGYMMVAYKGKYSDEWYDDCGEELGIDDGELTHWQPLPAPPSDATP